MRYLFGQIGYIHLAAIQIMEHKKLSIRSVNDDIELLISVSFCAVSSMNVSCCISVFDLFDESILVYFSVCFCTPFQCLCYQHALHFVVFLWR